MIQETISIRVLTASDGMVLTNGETYSTQVYLGVHDSPENWREVPESEVPDEEERKDTPEEADA